MKDVRTLGVLKIILYIIAGLVLSLGLVVGLSFIGSAGRVQNLLMPLQMMGGEVVFANLITPYLRGLLSGLGAATLVLTFVLSLLLFAIGRLFGTLASQEARLQSLEGQSQSR